MHEDKELNGRFRDGSRGGVGELLDRLEADVRDLSVQTTDKIAHHSSCDHATHEKVVNTARQNLSMSTRSSTVVWNLGRGHHMPADGTGADSGGRATGELLQGFRLSMRSSSVGC